jgi:hypothetical protein
MLSSTITPALLALASLSYVAAQGGQTCNATSLCPSAAPCCSPFNYCGDLSFCLGGCNPLASASPESCKPNPVCQSGTYSFKDLSRIQTNLTYYDGNATKYDWTGELKSLMSRWTFLTVGVSSRPRQHHAGLGQCVCGHDVGPDQPRHQALIHPLCPLRSDKRQRYVITHSLSLVESELAHHSENW